MKSVKCPECGFVGWADAERCKKCGVSRMVNTDLADDSHEPTATYQARPGDRVYSSGELKKGLAIASLVIGVLDIFTLGLLGIGAVAGIVLAVVALGKAKRNPQEYGGQSLATAGLVMSIISAVLIVPIGIIAAIAIPNLVASRNAANEAASIRALGTIAQAQQVYQSTNGAGQYGTLEQLAEQRLITAELASGVRYGYKFTVAVKPSGRDEPPRFEAVGVPETYGSTGRRSFYIDETGVIRGGDIRGAAPTELNQPLNSDGYSSSSPPSARKSFNDY